MPRSVSSRRACSGRPRPLDDVRPDRARRPLRLARSSERRVDYFSSGAPRTSAGSRVTPCATNRGSSACSIIFGRRISVASSSRIASSAHGHLDHTANGALTTGVCAATHLAADVRRDGALTDVRYPNATTVQRRPHRRKSECGIDRHVDRGELRVRSCAKAQRRVSLLGVVHGRQTGSPHTPRSCWSVVRRFADLSEFERLGAEPAWPEWRASRLRIR